MRCVWGGEGERGVWGGGVYVRSGGEMCGWCVWKVVVWYVVNGDGMCEVMGCMLRVVVVLCL